MLSKKIIFKASSLRYPLSFLRLGGEKILNAKAQGTRRISQRVLLGEYMNFVFPIQGVLKRLMLPKKIISKASSLRYPLRFLRLGGKNILKAETQSTRRITQRILLYQ